jgi:hypothetical protein
MNREFKTYEEFWPFYVAEHSDPACRAMHFAGTSAALAALAAGMIASRWWLAATPLAGYVFAWVGHLLFQKNRPATFRYPLWSLRGDFRMYRYMWLGRMREEVARCR